MGASTKWSIIIFSLLGLIVVAGSIFAGIQIGTKQLSSDDNPAVVTEDPSAEINDINFTETGSLQNCSSYASDMPYNNNCWGLAYTTSLDNTLLHTTLKFDSSSYCDFGQGFELCQITKLESYYYSIFAQNKKIKVEGKLDIAIGPLITVVKLTVVQ